MSDKPNTQLAVAMPPAMLAVATLSGLAPEYIIQTVKAQCFKGAATDAQVDAFISIAMEMKVNPLLPGMLYAYPIAGGGIVPIMGPSGVYKKLAEHPEVDSWETKVFPEDVNLQPTHAVTKIFRKGRERPLEYTALLSEWKIDTNPNWRSRPRHMLALRSLKHCANQIIHGIPYDEDDRTIMGAIDVTPEFRPADDATKGAAGAVNAAKDVTTTATPAAPAAAANPAPAATTETRATPKPRAPRNPKPEVIVPANEQTAAPADAAESSPAPAPAAPAATQTRIFLKDGERITTEVTVKSIETGQSKVGDKLVASVQATVEGGFAGVIRHSGGATQTSPGVITPNAPWAVGARLRVDLLGAMSKAATGPNVGKVLAWVQKVEAVTEAADETPPEET